MIKNALVIVIPKQKLAKDRIFLLKLIILVIIKKAKNIKINKAIRNDVYTYIQTYIYFFIK